MVVLGGAKTTGKLGLKATGALTSPLLPKASKMPLFEVFFQPGIKAGIGIQTKAGSRLVGVDHLGKVRRVGISHGTVGTTGGVTGTTAMHYDQGQDEDFGDNTYKILALQETGHAGAAALATRFAGQAGLRAGLSTYARSTGPLLAAEGMSYGLTGALSQTEIGRDLGFDKPMGFTEMNFETGKNLGTALMNSGADEDGETFGDRSREARDKADQKGYGGAANPLNYEYGSLGEGATSLSTWAVDTTVRRPLEFIGIL